MITDDSPAAILSQWLINVGIATPPENGQLWPVYVHGFPSAGNEAIFIFDTTGFQDGRIYRTGEFIHHPGIQIRLRAASDQNGYKKLAQIVKALEKLKNAIISIGGMIYTIVNTAKHSPIISLGEEVGTKRELFTFNCILSFPSSSTGISNPDLIAQATPLTGSPVGIAMGITRVS